VLAGWIDDGPTIEFVLTSVDERPADTNVDLARRYPLEAG